MGLKGADLKREVSDKRAGDRTYLKLLSMKGRRKKGKEPELSRGEKSKKSQEKILTRGGEKNFKSVVSYTDPQTRKERENGS